MTGPTGWSGSHVRRGSRIFERGGGPGADTGFFTSTPLGHCPRDVIRPLKNTPTLGHSQGPPPLGHCPRDVIHIPHTHPGSATGIHLRSTSKTGGGGPTLGPMLKSLHRGPKGGRGVSRVSGVPPGSATARRGLPHSHSGTTTFRYTILDAARSCL